MPTMSSKRHSLCLEADSDSVTIVDLKFTEKGTHLAYAVWIDVVSHKSAKHSAHHSAGPCARGKGSLDVRIAPSSKATPDQYSSASSSSSSLKLDLVFCNDESHHNRKGSHKTANTHPQPRPRNPG